MATIGAHSRSGDQVKVELYPYAKSSPDLHLHIGALLVSLSVEEAEAAVAGLQAILPEARRLDEKARADCAARWEALKEERRNALVNHQETHLQQVAAAGSIA